jgi:hypothetical protein
LMPRERVTALVDSGHSLASLAAECNVSLEAMANRIDNLNLRNRLAAPTGASS